MNGLKHANEVLGEPAFKLEDWKILGEYVYDEQGGRHQAFYSPVRDTVVMGETIKAHERVQVEQSFKYSKEGCDSLWRSAGVLETGRWMTDDKDYGKWPPISRHGFCTYLPRFDLCWRSSTNRQAAMYSPQLWSYLGPLRADM
jgi:hypothetical protein